MLQIPQALVYCLRSYLFCAHCNHSFCMCYRPINLLYCKWARNKYNQSYSQRYREYKRFSFSRTGMLLIQGQLHSVQHIDLRSEAILRTGYCIRNSVTCSKNNVETYFPSPIRLKVLILERWLPLAQYCYTFC